MASPATHASMPPKEFSNESSIAVDIKIPSLLPVPSSLAQPNDRLCSICSELGLTPSRFVVLPSDGNESIRLKNSKIQLGLVDDMRKRPHCPLCRLVLTSLGANLRSVEDGEPVIVTMTWGTDGQPVDEYSSRSQRIPQIRILQPNARKQSGRGIDPKRLNMFPEITMLANDSPTEQKTFFVRLIPDQIDFDIVRNWLGMCKIWHGAACDRSGMEVLLEHTQDPALEVPQFRLIDVVDNCIIRAPPGARYVALSYVWGRIDPKAILRCLQANVKRLEEAGALSLPENKARIPLTILDAMQVVRELRMRYLWVDSLCIIQDDEGPGGSKMGAISKMDLVYGGAYLTIMAASGIDANAGLPGVRPGTRGIKQAVEEILPGLRLGYKARHHDHLPSSTYYTRAWTYQERSFTKRNLLFIGGQVVFQCRRTDAWREDIFLEDRVAKFGTVARKAHDPDDMRLYTGHIQSYSALSLTYDTDIYHGFSGIGRFFRANLQVELCHGIPDAYFDWFLLWFPLVVQTRRKDAPSWSWSGWYGQSWPDMTRWYAGEGIKVRQALRERTWIIWYQRKCRDDIEVVRVWTPEQQPTTATTKNFYGGDVRSRFPFDCSQTNPTPRKLTGAPTYIEDSHNPNPGSGFLQFWTVSLMFRIDKATSEAASGKPRNFNTRLGIFGRENRELGIVYVQPEWAKEKARQEHEFILLCEGRDERPKAGNIDDEQGWKYRVMLIEWYGDWAERVAIASIEKQALDQALGSGAVWKEIILG